MMRIPTFITVFVAATAAAATAATTDSRSDSVVSVEFHEPESFTDFKTQPIESESDRIELQRALRDRIDRIARAEVPPQYHLALRIRDVDLAGEFEPQQGPDADSVRIVRDTYPPRITLEYTLTGPGGGYVSSGTRTLSDLAFQETLKTRTDDRLFHEAELIRNFIREITKRS